VSNKFHIRKDDLKKDKTYSKKHRFNVLSVLFLLVVFISSFSFKVQADASTLDEARYIVKNYYVSPVSRAVIYEPTIEDIVKALDDPYSMYFSKQQQQDFVDSINNKLYGIGVYIDMVPEGIEVGSVIEGSPAFEAGIESGDVITAANGQSLAGLTADKASSYIKGAAGTIVKLVVKRGEHILNFSVERKEISLPTVSGKMLNNHTAYIDITSFGEDTAQAFTQKLQELRMQNPDNYIVDLRNNGGGYMVSALDIAGNFIGPKPAIVVENRNGQKVRYAAADKGSTINKPIIFLINQYTASASEILSAAVKDYGKAFFIGTTTYGKGVAQVIFPLIDGSSLKLTVEKFYSPKGKTIQKVGISPDFEVKGVDSLAVADLFSGKCTNAVDKTGYMKVNLGGRDFEIDLNLAKDADHWAAFKYIIDKVPQDNVYIGTDKGWVKAPADYFDNIYKFLYSNYKCLNTLKDVPANKVFNIKLHAPVDINTIRNDEGIEIIDTATGDRAAFDVKKIDDKDISLIPKESLQAGHTYYLKIKDTIEPFTVAN
jgi:carboxyl-terminal processing protease